ncbi:uroporphyrinogen-III synthase [Gordonia neofelifaecis]|uniref:Bifunctional uroporphyrinogen-III synthetase/response regulator domain protein n=1 Tax=Gordonia neofelifaecis NRRL B-59395 TaxID=644548 RepID=F1YI14_9ACTN|nr:uroporphyrinogen-III synthase [Gordonia neofelifaecis]EGD55568.1 bifunctional uroporphyrinogen-III synthetase/response regulator domain protein [Gordonia neofelifaecis NRRL B-59395]
MSDAARSTPPSLAGFTVAITAARRAEEFGALLTRRGARVSAAPAIEMIPLSDDPALRAGTEAVIASPPDLLIPTTGIGFRGWIEAADEWGLADDLMAAFAGARIISRGPKVTGALRAAGLREEWSPESESSAEVLAHLRPEDVEGRRVAVQLHGAIDDWDPNRDFVDGLAAMGAEVVSVPVYSWQRPADLDAFDALIADVAACRIDAVTFTSGPAAVSMMTRARELGEQDRLLTALQGPVAVYCVGPVTAAPLEIAGVTTSWPERMRLGALARLVAEDLPERDPELLVAGHRLGLRAAAAVVDGEVCEVSGSSLRLLKALAEPRSSGQVGAVVSRAELLSVIGSDDEHAVEVAIGRLRASLVHREMIATVVKRGYRLAVDDR